MAAQRRSPRRNGQQPREPQPDAQTCWLCERALGRTIEWHHPVPKSRGGRETVPVHPICHRTVHASFDNHALARLPRDELVRAAPIDRFLRWVAGKDPDFHAPTRSKR